MQNTWRTLNKGDSVRIIAPSAKIDSAWEDLEKCCDFLKNLHLNPIYSTRLFSDNPSYYQFANTAEARYDDFVDALESDVKVIWCYRGGYGSDRVVHQLQHHHILPPSTPKLLVGFSDITNLHSYLNRQWAWPTLHASGLRLLAMDEVDAKDSQQTVDILFGKCREVHLSLVPMNKSAMRQANITAHVVGGNLTTLQCALGTAWETDTNNTILLLEDVGEAPYRIARMLQQFLANDYLMSVKAIVLGDFSPGKNADSALQEFADRCAVPVLRCEGVGHERVNHPVPLRTSAFLSLGKKEAILTIQTGASFR